jgi:hypothetical protein
MASLSAISSVFRLGRVTPGVSRMNTRGSSHTCSGAGGGWAGLGWADGRRTRPASLQARHHTRRAGSTRAAPPRHCLVGRSLRCPAAGRWPPRTWKPDICWVTPGRGPVRAVLWKAASPDSWPEGQGQRRSLHRPACLAAATLAASRARCRRQKRHAPCPGDAPGACGACAVRCAPPPDLAAALSALMMEDLPQLGTPTTSMMFTSAVGRSAFSQPTAVVSSCRDAANPRRAGPSGMVALAWLAATGRGCAQESAQRRQAGSRTPGGCCHGSSSTWRQRGAPGTLGH